MGPREDCAERRVSEQLASDVSIGLMTFADLHKHRSFATRSTLGPSVDSTSTPSRRIFLLQARRKAKSTSGTSNRPTPASLTHQAIAAPSWTTSPPWLGTVWFPMFSERRAVQVIPSSGIYVARKRSSRSHMGEARVPWEADRPAVRSQPVGDVE